MMTDLRFAVRQVLKSPAFSLLAVVTLALGIGLNTAIFSLINDLFLKGLPFKEPERLLHILTQGKGRTDEFQMSAPRFMLYRDGQTIFSGFAAENQQGATVTGLGDPLSVPIAKTTANWFDVLGVRPIMGRTFLPEEEEGADVAIITDRFWKARFAGSEDIIGKTIVLDGVTHTIVGVIPKLPVSWTGTPRADIWTTKPIAIPGFSYEQMMRGSTFLRAVGRLKPGVTVDQAKAQLGTLENSYASQFPEKGDAQFRNIIKTLPEDVTENLRPGFATLLTAVGFVLLIACSNVANLLLVRFSGRRREISLRLALGATRASVLRLFVFESVFISLLAGILGAVLAWWLVPLVPKLAANFLPIEAGGASALSVPVLLFTVGLSLLTGFAMGLYPALQTSRVEIVEALKEGGRGTQGSVRQQRFRKILVGAQVALSVTLLAGASLLITSFVRLSKQDPGFNPDKLWIGVTALSQAQYPDHASRARFAEQLQTALRGTPGFEDVLVSSTFPLFGRPGATLYTRPENNVPVPERKGAPSNEVMPGWFHAMGIPLIAGRDFNEQDVLDHPNVMIISKTGAKTVFGDENPIGKTLLITNRSVPVEIVGVVGDVRSVQLSQANSMEFYRPFAQDSYPYPRIVVRSSLPPETVTLSVKTALRSIDPNLALVFPQPFSEIMAQALGQARLVMVLLGVFAGIALLLATVGIYGAVSYTVEQRTSEIGVRMALGAQTRDVIRLILRQGMTPVVFGLVVGLAAALALGRLISSQLFQTSAYNPMLLSATLAILGMAALVACLIPAWRASAVNPVEALRSE